MLSWLFKKRGDVQAPTVPPKPARAAKPPLASGPAATAAAQAKPVAQPGTDWPGQLRAAQGDDEALLRIARSAAALEIKMAAVQALTAESALRQAEREFRSHDRKVHRVAKQRFEAAVAQRQARATARALLERTRSLMDEAVVPVNHVAALDRDWQALPLHALEPGQGVEFAELRSRLDALMRERDDAQQRLQRWTADAKRFLHEWQRTITAAAEHGSTHDVDLLGQAVEGLRQARPAVAATAELDLALARAHRVAGWVQIRLASFEAQAASAADAAETPTDTPTASSLAAGAGAEPQLPDAELNRVLDQRHAQRFRTTPPARPVVTVSRPTADKPPRPAQPDAPSAAQRLRLETLAQQAEAALAEGRFGEMQQHLHAVEVALKNTASALPDALRARLQTLRSERERLKDWQQWGGARARDVITAEAEELARETLAVADAGASGGPKLNLKSHGERIHALRLRWRELDRQGAVAGPDQWQRFDAALQTAHQPVAAQHAALQAARQQNLAAREALLDALEAQPVADASLQTADGVPDWREHIRSLDRFHSAWSKLGPIEHTVPIAAREPLQQRLRSALAIIEAPLQQARTAAAAERERLISRAECLLRADGGERPVHQVARQVRDLQNDWQDQARRLPLPRATEAALWTRFKAATGAVFALRDAASAARDAELAANLGAREALLQRLSGLGADLPLADVERAVAEIDRAWRQDLTLPRGASEGLEARFRAARAAASQALSAGARQRWQAQCDSVAARLALCELREDAGADGAEVADLGLRWDRQDSLPPAWEQALALRWARPVVPGPLATADVDDLLLQLETALDLPAAPEWQAARQHLKLRALKQAMEGRSAPKQGPTQQAEWWLAVLRQAGLDPAQRERLQALVAALREAPPGALGSPGVPAPPRH